MGLGSIGKAIGGIAKTVAAPLIGGAFFAYGTMRQNEAAREAAQVAMGFTDKQQAAQFEFQREAAQKQMDFQERGARSAWQWATQDMRAAGINPILAYQQGGAGAVYGSAPAGSAMGGTTYQPQNELAAAPEAVSSARAAIRDQAERRNLRQIHKNLKSTEENIEQDTVKKQQEAAVASQAAANLWIDHGLKRFQVSSARSEATKADIVNDFYKTRLGRTLLQIELGGRAIPKLPIRIGRRPKPRPSKKSTKSTKK